MSYYSYSQYRTPVCNPPASIHVKGVPGPVGPVGPVGPCNLNVVFENVGCTGNDSTQQNVVIQPINNEAKPQNMVIRSYGENTTYGNLIRDDILTTIKGNPRGSGAVDLAVKRDSCSQVASGIFSLIAGGQNNTSSGPYSEVLGGENNISTYDFSTILGGKGNTSGFIYSSIVGGQNNIVSGGYSVIVGGSLNVNFGGAPFSVICGGLSNTASNQYSVISGGRNNTVSNQNSVISGGSQNSISNQYSVISGGTQNSISGQYSVISGGQNNIVSGLYSVINGGYLNTISGEKSVISGGLSNNISKDYCFSSGGGINLTTSNYSAAFGLYNIDSNFNSTGYGFTGSGLTAISVNSARKFMIGNGPDGINRSNAFCVTESGYAIAKLGFITSSSADFAEYMESKYQIDGIATKIPIGTSVVLNDEGYIMPSDTPGLESKPVIGVISSTACLTSNTALEEWDKKYMKYNGLYVYEEEIEYEDVPQYEIISEDGNIIRKKPLYQTYELEDEFGNVIGTVEEPIIIKTPKYDKEIIYTDVSQEVEKRIKDEETKKIKVVKETIIKKEPLIEIHEILDSDNQIIEIKRVPKTINKSIQKKYVKKLNPDFDPNQVYIPRPERPEWNLVGLVGQVYIQKGQRTNPNWILIKDNLWLIK